MTADLVEALADAEHDSWSRWMRYVFSIAIHHPDGSCTIPADLVARWTRQSTTAYALLSEAEQESDRAEVRQILPLIATDKERLSTAVALLNAMILSGESHADTSRQVVRAALAR